MVVAIAGVHHHGGVETSRQPPASLKMRWTTDIVGVAGTGTLPVQLEFAGPDVDDRRRVSESRPPPEARC